MAQAAQNKKTLCPAIVSQWSSREWRLSNLYWIQDKFGGVVRFEMNQAQKHLLRDIHILNIVLKARQMGFSTFILIFALDCCLFNDHFSSGLVADTENNAKNLLKRAKFAYGRLPELLKKTISLENDNALEMVLSNGSKITAGTSLRSGTCNLLHVSEYGKICAKFPEKAAEIKSGAFNTLGPGQFGFIESTAEGRSGDFYDKCQAALRIKDAGNEPGNMEYKIHFFPWYMDATYVLEQDVVLLQENIDYFASLKAEYDIDLTRQQKNWYSAKVKEQGDAMWKEFPSTPDEAFKAAKDGAIYASILRGLRQRKMIGNVPFVPNIQVNTFWDFGLGDAQSIWLHQEVGGENRFIGFYENTGEGLAHYFDWLTKWRVMRGAVFGVHYAPHDVDHRRQGMTAKTIKEMAYEAGWQFETVQRTPNLWAAIESARIKMPTCLFDETACNNGLLHLENYSREWDEKMGQFKSYPRHDEHSHAASAFQTFTDGYRPVTSKSWAKQDRRWVV